MCSHNLICLSFPVTSQACVGGIQLVDFIAYTITHILFKVRIYFITVYHLE